MRIVLASEAQSRNRAMIFSAWLARFALSGINEKAIREPDQVALTKKLARQRLKRLQTIFPMKS